MKYELQSTQTFAQWFSKQKDKTVKNQLLSRLARVENGTMATPKPCPQICLSYAAFLVAELGCTTQSVTNVLFYCWLVAINPAKPKTLKKPKLY